jgi:phosphopentomutase
MNGQAVIERYAQEQLATGRPIVYNGGLGGDSVFQIAAHTDVIPLEQLYRWCEQAREQLTGEFAIGRVIARPYNGPANQPTRLPTRRDWAIPPPRPTAIEALSDAGVRTVAVGKIEDIFCGRGIAESFHDGDNAAASMRIRDIVSRSATRTAELVVANLVDFDSRFGHNRDPYGMAQATIALDQLLDDIHKCLGPSDRLILTADHGNDPTWQGSSHTREQVPFIMWDSGQTGAHLPDGQMSDLAATLVSLFGVEYACNGQVLG